MEKDLELECEAHIRERLKAAGPDGLSTTGLQLGHASSKKGKACRQVLRRMLKEGKVGNLGSSTRPCYVSAEHFKPLEIAYEGIERRAREAGTKLGSRRTLSEGLTGAVGKKVDEALKLLVAEGVLVRLKWAGKPVYVHACALPRPSQSAEAPGAEQALPDEADIRRAYRETVNEFGYPDVLIYEVFRRLGGELEPFKKSLLNACRTGRAVPNIGDWSLSTAEERSAALYINGHPHLRIRFKE